MGLPQRVFLREEGPREGFQSEPDFVPTADKVRLIDALSDTGVREVQVTSFVRDDLVPQMRDAEEVVRRITRREGVLYSATCLNPRGLQRAIDTGRLDLVVSLTLYASESYGRNNVGRNNEQLLQAMPAMVHLAKTHGLPVRVAVLAAFGCNYEGEMQPQRVIQLVGRLMSVVREHGLQLEEIMLADTMGWANPLSIANLVDLVRNGYPQAPICLHLHDTRGTGMVNAYAGLEAGVDRFDTAIGGLGGSPFARNAAGNLPTEDLAFLCEELGIDTGIDLDSLVECAALAEAIVGRPLPGKLLRGGTLSSFRI